MMLALEPIMQGHAFMWSWWLLVLTSLSVALTKVTGTSQNWKYAGCFADPVSQALIPTDQVSNSIVHRNMTVERCVDFCENKHYTIAALEMTSNCFCANEFAGPLINSTQCNTPCGGDYEQMCGGTGSVSVYTNGFALVNSSASPNVSQVQATSLWTRYHDHGCFPQASSATNASARQAHPFKITSNNMTQEECQNQCATNSFKIANLHNGSECQCAHCFTFKLRRSNNCESPCSGNPKQNCGGVRSMLIFVRGGTNPRGCGVSSIKSTKTSLTQLNGASLFGHSKSALTNATSAAMSSSTFPPVSNTTTLTANVTVGNTSTVHERTTAFIYPIFLSNTSLAPIIRIDNENFSTIVSVKNSSFSDGSDKLGNSDSTTKSGSTISVAGSTTSMANAPNSSSSTVTPVNVSATFIRVLFPNDANQLLQNASTTNFSSSSTTTTTSASSTTGSETTSTSTDSSTSTATMPTMSVFLNTTSTSSSNIIVSVSAGNATSTTSTPLPSAAENSSKGVPNNNATSLLPSSTSTSSTSSAASSTNSITASATESTSTTSGSSTSSEVSPSLSTTLTPLNMANVANSSATSTSSTTSQSTSIVAQTPLMPMLGTSSTTSEIDPKTESTTFSALAANSTISESSTTTTTTLGRPSSSTASLGIIIQMPSTTTASDTPTSTGSVAISSTTSATTTTSSA